MPAARLAIWVALVGEPCQRGIYDERQNDWKRKEKAAGDNRATNIVVVDPSTQQRVQCKKGPTEPVEE